MNDAGNQIPSLYDSPAIDQMRNAALARLARRDIAQGDKGSKKGGQGALMGGIVGAILGSMASNPMAGYAVGSQLGSAAGRGNLDMETGVQLAPSLLKTFLGGGAAK